MKAVIKVGGKQVLASLGDTILVKCIGINDKGQVDLSRKDALTL